MGSQTVRVVLHWIPVGAGGHFVRWNGRAYERVVALREHRPVCELFHTALEVDVDQAHHVIEMGPVWNVPTPERGAAVEGPVGARWLGLSRAFRYEVRCWRDGVIPDVDEAVLSTAVSHDPERARRVLALVPHAPRLTWGRDELGLGEMWNSNSLMAWLLSRSGHETTDLVPPPGGRAPGWDAGLALAGTAPHRP